MRNLAHEAGFRSLDEVKEGRRATILMPPSWGCIAFDMGAPPDGVKLWFSDSELLEPADVLIIVPEHGHGEYLSQAVEYADKVVVIRRAEAEPLVFEPVEPSAVMEHVT